MVQRNCQVVYRRGARLAAVRGGVRRPHQPRGHRGARHPRQVPVAPRAALPGRAVPRRLPRQRRRVPGVLGRAGLVRARPRAVPRHPGHGGHLRDLPGAAPHALGRGGRPAARHRAAAALRLRHHRPQQHAGQQARVCHHVSGATCHVCVCRQLVPFFVGLTILAIGVCFGFNCGYAINPARDFAPRLFSGESVITYLNIYPYKYDVDIASGVRVGAGRVHEPHLPLVAGPRPGLTHRSNPRGLGLLPGHRYSWHRPTLGCLTLAFPEINFPPSENTDHNGMDLSYVKVSAAV